jgi:hypothetical protein
MGPAGSVPTDSTSSRAAVASAAPGRAVAKESLEVGLAGGAWQPEQHRVRRPAGRGEIGVPRELGGYPAERLGAGVVLEEEVDPATVFDPGPVNVGADYLAVVLGATPLGPPGDQSSTGMGAGVRGEGTEEAVDAERVVKAVAGVARRMARRRSSAGRGGSTPRAAAVRAAPVGPRV